MPLSLLIPQGIDSTIILIVFGLCLVPNFYDFMKWLKCKGYFLHRNYELVGATSFGRQCALAGFPGVYADVFRESLKLFHTAFHMS